MRRFSQCGQTSFSVLNSVNQSEIMGKISILQGGKDNVLGKGTGGNENG